MFKPAPFRPKYASACLTFTILLAQVAPLALASSPSSVVRAAQTSESAPPASVTFSQRPVPAPLPPGGGVPNISAVPNITATKVDAFPDPNADGKADPGETITYTVTISNTGTADATNVAFSDTVDANTTLVPGSITTQPIAVADSYNVIGNVRIQPNAAAGLLANDCDPDPAGGACTNAGLTVTTLAGDSTAPFAGTSTQGGQVTSSTTDGAFAYNPPPGFAGTDTFTYTVTDGTGKTDTATVTLTVGNGTASPGTNVIWFVNPSSTVGG